MDVIIYTVMVTFTAFFGSYSSLLGCFSSLEAAKAAADELIKTNTELIKYGQFYDKITYISIARRGMDESRLYDFSILTYSGTTKEWMRNPLIDRFTQSELHMEDDKNE